VEAAPSVSSAAFSSEATAITATVFEHPEFGAGRPRRRPGKIRKSIGNNILAFRLAEISTSPLELGK
jgi:hypothetical protein